MAALSQFFSHLYTLTIIFFTILLLELVILVRSLASNFNTSSASDPPPLSTAHFLDLVEENIPASLFSHNTTTGSRIEPTECAVCLSMVEEGEEIRNLKCNHMFHKVCLDTWLQQDWATCPLCRTVVVPVEIVMKFRQRRNHHHHHHHQDQYDGSDEELIFLLSAIHGNNLHRLL
ncbi:hypothetical protein ACSBR2_009145 [Camellia fascicularis]